MPIKEALDRAWAWMEAYVRHINESQFATSSRTRVGCALLDLAAEHQKAIFTLANHALYGSCLAMLRPELEACVRGIWYLRCATDEQVKSFIAGEEPPRIKGLLEAVESLPEHSDRVLSKIKVGNWRYLCDFTHAGILQVKARVGADELASQHDERHIAAMIDASVLIALRASCEFGRQTDRPEIANRLLAAFNELFSSRTA